jgi:hypothetical protein
MEDIMVRCNTTTVMTGLLTVLAITVSAAATEPQLSASDKDAAQLKAAQEERIEVLTKLVTMLTSQYNAGTADIVQVHSAESDLCNALLDSTDEPEKPVALLTKQLEMAKEILVIARSRLDSGNLREADVFRAKSLFLDVKIKLLKERSRRKPPTPSPRGRRP